MSASLPCPPSPGEPVNCISVRGARTHNLQQLSVDLPRDQLVVISGRSGSGKSSLAFDTLFAEGQRQYLESLSLATRQFIGQLPRADVDSVTGLPPTVCLDQSAPPANRRSTVGTVSEIYDFLRVLLARVGEVRCQQCGQALAPQTLPQIRNRLMALPEGTKVMVLAAVTDGSPGSLSQGLQDVRRHRLVRVRLAGEIHDIDRLPPLDPQTAEPLEVVTDRIIVRPGVERRLLEALDHASSVSLDGRVTSMWLPPESGGPWIEQTDATQFSCPDCGLAYDEVQPRCFSFNSPYGACPDCEGLGARHEFDPEAIVDWNRSLAEGAVRPWATLPPASAQKWHQQLQPLLSHLEIDVHQPWARLSPEQRRTLLDHRDKEAPGLRLILHRELATTAQEERLEELERLMSDLPCATCGGARVGPLARSVFLDGRSIGEVTKLTMDELLPVLDGWSASDSAGQAVAASLIDNIRRRAEFLRASGVGYLTLNRGTPTLSGGEYQRVRLAAALGAGVTSACFILDEPSVGLHPSDTARLLKLLRNLQAQGNSLILVEHNPEIIAAADHLVDLGPGAGLQGGRLIAQGTPQQVAQVTASPTGRLLRHELLAATGEALPVPANHPRLKLTGASGNNLQDAELALPLARLTCVTGVSGSGKSTLVVRTLAPAVARALGQAVASPAPYRTLSGWEGLQRLVEVDQQPIGRSSRACPATYCGLLDPIRKLFAATRAAKQLGFGIGRFTFNGKSGACRDCRGLGYRKIELDFIPPAQVPCETCQGRRYNRQTLQVRFASRSIADVLALTVDQAREAFDGFETLRSRLDLLIDVGLGYLQLGQPAHTLSGGEAQRLKLANQLARPGNEPSLIVLDEPTLGLHAVDVVQLLAVLRRLVRQGHTLVVVEHHLQVMAAADWIVDLGPGGGQAGGRVVASGAPADVAAQPDSRTGRYLQRWLAQHPAQPAVG